MKTFERGIEPFVVSGESAEACGPSEAAFNDPAAGQQYETTFGHRVLDDFQPQTVLLGRFGGIGPV